MWEATLLDHSEFNRQALYELGVSCIVSLSI
jgi:hypothetical protein